MDGPVHPNFVRCFFFFAVFVNHSVILLFESRFSHGSLVAVSLVCALGSGPRRGVVVLIDVVVGICVACTSSFDAAKEPLHSALVAGETLDQYAWVGVFAHGGAFSVQSAFFADVQEAVKPPVVVTSMSLPNTHVVTCVRNFVTLFCCCCCF